jgi:hypothetical protein
MKLRLAFALSCGVVWAIGSVSSAGAQMATGDSVTGTLAVTEPVCVFIPPSPPFPGFTRCLTPDRYSFDAQSGPAGEAPSGTVIFATGERAGLFTDFGTVSCLAVTGNRASIGVNFQGFIPVASEAHAAVIYVEDLGGEAQDKIAVQDLAPGVTAPSVCPAARPPSIPLQPTFPVDFDDWQIIVIDTLARPTTKDQCNNGGWKTYGIFKNQGDCVSFVATGGKNPPGGP